MTFVVTPHTIQLVVGRLLGTDYWGSMFDKAWDAHFPGWDYHNIPEEIPAALREAFTELLTQDLNAACPCTVAFRQGTFSFSNFVDDGEAALFKLKYL